MTYEPPEDPPAPPHRKIEAIFYAEHVGWSADLEWPLEHAIVTAPQSSLIPAMRRHAEFPWLTQARRRFSTGTVDNFVDKLAQWTGDAAPKWV